MNKKLIGIGIIIIVIIGLVVWRVRVSRTQEVLETIPEAITSWQTIQADGVTVKYPTDGWRAGLSEPSGDCVDACLSKWKNENPRVSIYPTWQEGADDAIQFVVPASYDKKTCDAFAKTLPDAAVYCPNPVAYYYFYTKSQHPGVLAVFDELVNEASN